MPLITNSSTLLRSYSLCTTLKKDSINYILYAENHTTTTIKTLYYNESNTIVSGDNINISLPNIVTDVDCGIMNIVVYGNDNIQHTFLLPIYYNWSKTNILNLVDLFYKNDSL